MSLQQIQDNWFIFVFVIKSGFITPLLTPNAGDTPNTFSNLKLILNYLPELFITVSRVGVWMIAQLAAIAYAIQNVLFCKDQVAFLT
jgi:hypothetical protein